MLLGALAQAQSDATVRDEDALDVSIDIVRAAAAQLPGEEEDALQKDIIGNVEEETGEMGQDI